MKFIIKHLISSFGSKIYNLISYKYLHKKFSKKTPKIIWENPSRFNQKIIWLKRNYRLDEAFIYADKFLVKKFVEKKVSSEIIIPTIGSWDDVDQIDFNLLTKPFILKANHGSGMIKIFKKKDRIDINSTKKLLKKWMKTNYGFISGEYQYKNIERKIIAEPFLSDDNGNQLKDFKFFCFHGKPKFVQVDFDRHTKHTRNFYDLNWQKLNFTYLYKSSEIEAKKPNQLAKMIKIAEILSENFKFIRVDLYEYKNRVFFGELTFHPEGGFGPITPDYWDYKIGKYLKI